MTAVAITFWPRLTNPQGQRVTTTWPKLIERLSVPRVVAVKEDAPGFALATFAGDKRALANVERVYAIGIDLDEQVDLEALRPRFNGCSAFVHTTWKSTPDLPRCRLFLLLSRPVTGDEYRGIYGVLAAYLEKGGLVVDRQASDPSRLWFLPSIRSAESSFVCWSCDGPPINVEGVLDKVPPPAPAPRPSPRPVAPGRVSAVERARKYLAACPGAISGSGGHQVTFVTASKVVRGFALSTEEALDLMLEWNERCVPPWSERELRRKVEQAASQGRMGEGDMLERTR